MFPISTSLLLESQSNLEKNMLLDRFCFGWLLLHIHVFFSVAWSKLLCCSQLLWDQATKQSSCRLPSENNSFDVYRWCLIAVVSLSTSIIEILIIDALFNWSQTKFNAFLWTRGFFMKFFAWPVSSRTFISFLFLSAFFTLYSLVLLSCAHSCFKCVFTAPHPHLQTLHRPVPPPPPSCPALSIQPPPPILTSRP